MTNILAIDTASEHFAVAWLGADLQLRTIESSAARDHSRQLIAAIAEVVADEIDSIDAILVTTGPGSYAGLRVGIATAEGLALARGVPVYGVGTLEAAANAGAHDGRWTVVHPIGRGEFAAQVWDAARPLTDIRVAAPAELAGTRLAGEGAGTLGGEEIDARTRAEAAIALRRLEIDAGAVTAGADAFYIREPHITRPRRAAMGLPKPNTSN